MVVGQFWLGSQWKCIYLLHCSLLALGADSHFSAQLSALAMSSWQHVNPPSRLVFDEDEDNKYK